MADLKTVTIENDLLNINQDEVLVRLKDCEQYARQRVLEELYEIGCTNPSGNCNEIELKMNHACNRCTRIKELKEVQK